MNHFLKYTGSFVVAVLVVVSANYVYAVLRARAYTQNVILADLGKSQWRYPDGLAQQFELHIHDLNKQQVEILIKVQDPGFYGHKGVDLSTPGGGLTTITQAIIKKLYFERFEPGIAKIKQTLIARFVVNGLITKEDQLTLFINTMYFGRVDDHPIVGLESAAHAYYHQTITRLTQDQYISLIAMLVMPGTFHLIDHPEWNRERTRRIKAVIAGEYEPKGLMDQFYGELPQDVIDAGLPPVSYIGPLRKDN